MLEKGSHYILIIFFLIRIHWNYILDNTDIKLVMIIIIRIRRINHSEYISEAEVICESREIKENLLVYLIVIVKDILSVCILNGVLFSCRRC